MPPIRAEMRLRGADVVEAVAMGSILSHCRGAAPTGFRGRSGAWEVCGYEPLRGVPYTR
ncbi:hypothetical protein PSU4_10000 [Pseudonocardia sulfidoxydans NBRC 16205]|uniref:Uncharacterized protein n=1 Tax=Pseudonocardia sulfidoxydans NBRC 16205 TaxID=1223511 RepID=A0A511DB62_9PSEU|nr:hypothetical protein PSU4_10000 [Pseudonocardia sulfidoxydans NBRC 16205]